MAITGLSTKKRPYVLKSDRGSSDPTVFTIKSLSRAEMAEINKNNKIKPEDDVPVEVYLKRSVFDWTPFPDQEGEIVNYSPENLDKLPLYAVNEIFAEVTGSIPPDEAKNSARQSSSASGSEKSAPSSGIAAPA